VEIKKEIPKFDLKYSKFSMTNQKMINWLYDEGHMRAMEKEIRRKENPSYGSIMHKPLFEEILGLLDE
jgi:hypothetical protein